MTGRAPTTYRRIGDHDEDTTPDGAAGGDDLRRIGDDQAHPAPSPAPPVSASVPPAPAATPPLPHDGAARSTVDAGGPAVDPAPSPAGPTTPASGAAAVEESWSVPHPDDLDEQADGGDGTATATVAEGGAGAVRTAKRRPSPVERPVAGDDREVRTRRGPLLALGIVTVLLAAAVVVLSVVVVQRSDRDSLRASALSTARTDGVLLSSYDYRNLTGPGSAWSKVEAASTPAFRKNFLSTSADLGKLLTQYNATATGKVLTAGIASLSGQRAVVLLFIDQTVTNTVQKGSGTTQPLRTQLTLVRQGGRWLVNDLQVPK